MKVLIVHDELLESGYGAESYVRRLVTGLRSAGDTVETVAGERRHRGAAKLFDAWDPLAWRLVSDRAQRFSPDVIHHHNIARELSASVLTAAPHIPAVMTVHDKRMLGAREHSRLTPYGVSEAIGSAVLLRTARRHLSATIGVSEELSAALVANDLPNVSTVGVPVLEPVGPTQSAVGCRDVAIIGRLAPDKGVDVVIDAFATLGDVAHGSRLIIAGDGPSRASLQRRAAPLGDQVSFLGRLGETQVSALLGRVRVVVVASLPGRRPEGSSLSVVEAAAHGRPVIGSDDPAVREVLEHVGSGEVVPAGDPKALADALRRYLIDDELVATVAERARRASSSHSIEAVTRATRAVYAYVLGRTV